MDSMFALSLWHHRAGNVAEARAYADQLMALDLSALEPSVAASMEAKHAQLQSAMWGTPAA